MNEKKLRVLARNAKVGDGCFWKHPESVRHNIIFTGTNRYWLEYKAKLAGDMASPVTEIRKAGSVGKGVFSNSKKLYSLKINVHDIFGEYKDKNNICILNEMSDEEIAMWYLDDGCCIERKDHRNKRGVPSYRYLLCIGNFCEENAETEKLFIDHMVSRFKKIIGNNAGRVVPNNSKATARNKNWAMPVAIGKYLVNIAKDFNVSGFDKKLRFRL